MKIILKSLCVFILFISYAHSSWQDLVQDELNQRGLDFYYPDTRYLKPWQIDDDVVLSSKLPTPEEIGQISVACEDKRLFATHPQQTTKEYMYALWADYDYTKLPVDSVACTIPNPTRKYCLRATWAKLVVMSDTFEDSCGNQYRAYWMVNYLMADESMGTLVSKGRTIYEKPRSQFPGEFVTGNTYELREDDFLMLSPVWKGDQIKINQSRTEAFKQGYRMQGKLFIIEN